MRARVRRGARSSFAVGATSTIAPAESSATQSPTTGSSVRSESRRSRLVMRLRLLARRRQDVVLAAMLHRDTSRGESLFGVRLERCAPGGVPAEGCEVRHAPIVTAQVRRRLSSGRERDRCRSSALRTRTPRRARRAGSARLPRRSTSSPISPNRARIANAGVGEDRRASERLAERVRELLARHGIRRREIHDAIDVARRERSRTPRSRSSMRRPSSTTACRCPTRPPSPSLNGRSIRASAPPSFASTTPWRKLTTRIPASRAGSAAASQARTTSASNPVPSVDSSVTISSPRSP